MISATKTKWVHLTGFLVKFWCPSFLKAVRNSFGIIIFVEDRSALRGRMNSYRILVSMAEDYVFPSSVMVETARESIWDEVLEDSEGPSEQWF